MKSAILKDRTFSCFMLKSRYFHRYKCAKENSEVKLTHDPPGTNRPRTELQPVFYVMREWVYLVIIISGFIEEEIAYQLFQYST